MKSREICVWLDERWYDALSRHLKDETVEDKLGDYLDQLINELVPEQESGRRIGRPDRSWRPRGSSPSSASGSPGRTAASR